MKQIWIEGTLRIRVSKLSATWCHIFILHSWNCVLDQNVWSNKIYEIVHIKNHSLKCLCSADTPVECNDGQTVIRFEEFYVQLLFELNKKNDLKWKSMVTCPWITVPINVLILSDSNINGVTTCALWWAGSRELYHSVHFFFWKHSSLIITLAPFAKVCYNFTSSKLLFSTETAWAKVWNGTFSSWNTKTLNVMIILQKLHQSYQSSQ